MSITIPNTGNQGVAPFSEDLQKLAKANEEVKILTPEQLQKLTALLTQDTVSKADLRQAKKIVHRAHNTCDRNEDKIAMRIAEENGIDWKPGDGWHREVNSSLLSFGAATVLLEGGIINLKKEFPETTWDRIKEITTNTAEFIKNIPVAIALGVAAAIALARHDAFDRE